MQLPKFFIMSFTYMALLLLFSLSSVVTSVSTRRPTLAPTRSPLSIKKPSAKPLQKSSIPSSSPSHTMLVSKSRYVSSMLSADQIVGIVIASIAIIVIIVFVITYGKDNRNFSNQMLVMSDAVYNPMMKN